MTTSTQQEEEHKPLPVRMINEYAYCPRLFHLMHVEGRWEDNEYTVDGRIAHRRVDAIDQLLPSADQAQETKGDEPPKISRSVTIESKNLKIVGKLDLVSTAGDQAMPVETKRGRVPKNPERSWEPERIQLMAQALLLREQDYEVDHGVLYFVASKTRVDIEFTPQLEARTREVITKAHQASQSTTLPDPLEDSPKCRGCSLAGICLPDETLTLREVPDDTEATGVRRLYPVREEAVPLYIQEQGATIGKRGSEITVKKRREILATARLKDISQLVLCGSVMISAQAMHTLCEAGIPIIHLSTGHWFYGYTTGITLRNAYARAAQYAHAADSTKRLELAQAIVQAKAQNQRTILTRNLDVCPPSMDRLIQSIPRAKSIESLLGMEGIIAKEYFSVFGQMLSPKDFASEWGFDNRNRRPPRDPVNALLSFGYALLAKECSVALLGEGLDPWWGMYHRPRHGRPSLALDLMEEFRPLIVDSAVLSAINTGMVTARSFERTSKACMLNKDGRTAFIRAYEARIQRLVTHPVFGYRVAWRSVIRLQARLMAHWMRGDVPAYRGMVTR